MNDIRREPKRDKTEEEEEEEQEEEWIMPLSIANLQPGILETHLMEETSTSVGDYTNLNLIAGTGEIEYHFPLHQKYAQLASGQQTIGGSRIPLKKANVSLDSISNTIYIGSEGVELSLQEKSSGAAKLLSFCWDGSKLLIQVSKELLPNIILDIKPEESVNTGPEESTPTKYQDPFWASMSAKTSTWPSRYT